MILVGNQRSGAQDLARHLVKDENDHVFIHELRGFVANDLEGAFREVETLSKGTRCTQYLFSLSLNPPQNEKVSTKSFENAIERAEKQLGLNDQPRAIVFHEKDGRRHAHVVWSRIDVQKMKAVQLSHSRRKLNSLSKQLYLDHGWRLPPGHQDKGLSDSKNFTLADWQQAKRNGQDPRKIRETLQSVWHQSKTGETLKHNLEQHGYYLAQGDRRNVVVIDRFGEIRSLPRQLKVRTKDVKDRLGDLSALCPVKEVRADIQKRMTKALSVFTDDLNKQAKAIKAEFKTKLEKTVMKQRAERLALSNKQASRRAREIIERQGRFRKGLKGAWDILRGEHFRISQKNKLDAAIAADRDREEQDKLIQQHLGERRKLKLEKQQDIEQIREIRKQRVDLQAELKSWRENISDKPKRQSKDRSLSL